MAKIGQNGSWGNGTPRLGENGEFSEAVAKIGVDGEWVEVGASDGDIPEAHGSPIYHYPFLERADSTVTEEIQGEDATASGATNISGNWAGEYAEEFGGSDRIDATSLPDFFDRIGTDPVALTFTFETTDTDQCFMALDTTSDPRLQVRQRGRSGSADDINVWYSTADGTLEVETQEGFSDGQKYRCVINIPDDDAANTEVWINGTEESLNIELNNGAGGMDSGPDLVFGIAPEFTSDYTGALDNPTFHDDTLSSTEIQDDYNEQPWS